MLGWPDGMQPCHAFLTVSLQAVYVIRLTWPQSRIMRVNGCVLSAGSWQEMAAVLDMLQDISVPSERSQPGRPASARSPSVSPTRRKPRCASAFGPSSASGANNRQPQCSSGLSDYGSPAKAQVRQGGSGVKPVQQQLCSGVMSPDGSLWSGAPVKGSFKGSPLTGPLKRRQDWQS